MYSEYLTFVGFRVAEAATGDDAVVKTLALIPDVVLMDLSLPGLDGCAATRVIKADPRTRGVRVIALTGFAFSTHATQARDAGFDDYVTKPCLPIDLANKIDEHIMNGLHRPSRRRTIASGKACR
jgi:two-component system, cell cycle response regulator DivK